MSCLGVLFSLDKEDVEKLKAYKSDVEKKDYLQEDIEELYFKKFPERVAELDKSWDGLHRCFNDGKYELINNRFPLSNVILGGENIYNSDNYIMSLKKPEIVVEIYKAIKNISKEDLRKGYNQISSEDKDYSEFISEEDFEYTWNWFNYSKGFWKLASEENRYVLFTADQ